MSAEKKLLKEIKKLRDGESFMQDVLADQDKELAAKDEKYEALINKVEFLIERLDEDENIRFVGQASQLLKNLISEMQYSHLIRDNKL